MDIQKMKRERKEKIDAATIELRKEVDAILAKGADATAEEREACDKRVAAHKEYCDRSEADIAREERLQAAEAQTTVAAATQDSSSPEAQEAFRSFGEWVSEAIGDASGKKSERLEKRATTFGNNPSAGYLVPPEFDTTIRMVAPEDAIVRPRALVVPSSAASPDATINLIALDQSGEKGVHAGLVVNWVAENAARTSAGDLPVKQIELSPKLISAYMDVSNKLINNYAGIGALVQSRMRLAIISAEEQAFLRGTGGTAQPTGFIGHASNATVARQTVSTITLEDLFKLDSLALSGGEYVFIASRSAMPTLRGIKDTAGNLIWQENARVGSPGTLLGRPVFFSERVPVLGTRGDLTLVNLQAYAIKDGTPLTLLIDPYTQAVNGITRLYVTWSVDGIPLLETPIKGEDGVKRSAFVTLT
jgi:HK97 family phage major capsid protein